MNKNMPRTQFKYAGRGFVLTFLFCALSACLPHEVGSEGDSHLSVDLSKATLTAQQLQKVTEDITSFLTTRFKQAEQKLDSQYASCSDAAEATEHMYALLAFGRERECLQAVSACLSEVSGLAKGKMAHAGAKCASKAGNYDQAYEFYRESTTRDRYANDAEYLGRVFDFASFVESVGYKVTSIENPEQLAKEVFALGFSSDGRDSFVEMYSLVRANIAGNSNVFDSSVSNLDFDAFMKSKISAATPEFADYLRLVQYRVLSGRDARGRDALVAMQGWLSNDKALAHISFNQLHTIFTYSYSNIYIQRMDGIVVNRGRRIRVNAGLYNAQQLYRAYLPYSNTKYGLPVSQNTYTYEEIYNLPECKDHLLDGENLAALKKIGLDWASGTIDAATALGRAQKLDTTPVKADVKTFIANLYYQNENLDEAEKHYAMAHDACPFYNRAHDGLRAVRSKRSHAALPDSQSIQTEFLSKADSSVLESLQRYVVNYASMTAQQKRLLAASIDFFAPFVGVYAERGYRMYLKHAFQRLSDIPGLEQYGQGGRSEGDDQRLRDDIEGIAPRGRIVASLSFLEDVPYYGSNVAVHEVAHQFHELAGKNIDDCIKELYDTAKARNNGAGLFSVGYAARNEFEYFAMGVEHYTVPEDAGSLKGINRGWYLDNDPRLYLLIQKIEAADSLEDVSRISCPQPTDPVPLSKPKRDVKVSVLKGADGKGQYLAAALDVEVENAYVCFSSEVECRNQPSLAKELVRRDYQGSKSFFVYPYDLKINEGDSKSMTVLGKLKSSSKFTHSIPVTVEN